MLIEDGKLRGKKIITADGREVGEVGTLEIEIELDTWKIQWLELKLLRDVLEALGLKKPLFGTIHARLAPERIRSVTDNVVLTVDFAQLGTLLASDEPDGVEKKK
jgi:sporulation protein YlmC with PRC-barrel domain